MRFFCFLGFLLLSAKPIQGTMIEANCKACRKCQQYFSATRHENVSRNCAKIYALDGIGANYFLETRNWWFSTQGSIVIDRTQLQLTYTWPQTTCFCVRADRASKYPPSHILMLKPTGEKSFQSTTNSFANTVLLIPKSQPHKNKFAPKKHVFGLSF